MSRIIAYFLIVMTFVSAYLSRGYFIGPERAIRAVARMGFRDIKVVDKSVLFIGFIGCDEHDAAMFTVEGTNPTGMKVRLNVCVGWPFRRTTIQHP